VSWIDLLLSGIRSVASNGAIQAPQPTINFTTGLTVTPNAANASNDVAVTSINRLPFGPVGLLTTPPDVSTFTLQNPVGGGSGAASTASIINHPSGYGVAIYGTGNSAHECFNGVFITRGTKTTLIVQIDAPYWDAKSDGTINAPPFGGITIYSPSNNKSLMWGVYAGNSPGGTGTAGNQIYLFQQNIAGASTVTSFSLLPARSLFPIWLKWHDDGANYTFSYSFDGQFTNAPTVSQGRTAFLADAGTQIGVAAGAIQSAGTRSPQASFALWLGSWAAT
jgi:hypothetical protein